MSTNLLDRTSTIHSVIDGKPWKTSSTFAVVDPHTGNKLHDVYGVNVDEAIQAVEAAQRAFPGTHTSLAHFNMLSLTLNV